MLRFLHIVMLFVALLQVSCTHTLRECAACGPGKVCQKTTLARSSMPVTQCFTPCKTDRDCGKDGGCNCDDSACMHHSEYVPLNVCLPAPTRSTNEMDQRFSIDERDRRVCTACKPGEICLDSGTRENPQYRCVRQCSRDSDCEAPMLCNCGTEYCTYHDGRIMSDICLPPAPGTP